MEHMALIIIVMLIVIVLPRIYLYRERRKRSSWDDGAMRARSPRPPDASMDSPQGSHDDGAAGDDRARTVPTARTWLR